MGFLRPDVQATLWRWRETLLGGMVGMLGLWWALAVGGLMILPGGAALMAGAGLIWIGVQRARFRGPGGGVGAVEVDEGQITYLGPLTGGAVSLRELERLSLDATARPAHWRLDQPGQETLMIPVNAAGSEALFDAFATLPGLRTERMLAELRGKSPQTVVIWERTPLRPPHALLH